MLLHPSTVTDGMPPRLARPEVAASHDGVASDQSGALGAVGLGQFDIEERRDRSPSLLGMIVRPTVADQVSDSICSRTLRGGHTGRVTSSSGLREEGRRSASTSDAGGGSVRRWTATSSRRQVPTKARSQVHRDADSGSATATLRNPFAPA
jgi:hypothetical protein